MGKRRKCWLPAFSPFLTVYLKGFFLRVVQNRHCAVKSERCLSKEDGVIRITYLRSSIWIPWQHFFVGATYCEKKLMWLQVKLTHFFFNIFFCCRLWKGYYKREIYQRFFLHNDSTNYPAFELNPFPNKPWFFYGSAVQVFWKHCGKRRNCS